MFYLGIDVSKAKLDCMLLDSSTGKVKSKSLANTPIGFNQLLEWLDKQKAINPHVVMEPTGVYHEGAALALADAGLIVSLVNPAQLRAFAQGLGVKTKTDKEDSMVLARFGALQKPAAWHADSKPCWPGVTPYPTTSSVNVTARRRLISDRRLKR